jgi:glycosyltransferase involved in cell wall biosynthesis
MNILLIGEYSRLHNSLKEGLQKLGHRVVILGFNDGFKDFPVDYKLIKKWDQGWRNKIKVGLYKLTGFNLTSYLTYQQFEQYQSNFKHFDVVQLINENSFYCDYYYEKKILKYIFKHNQNVFLLSCGDDFVNVKYNFENPKIKSVIQPYLNGKIKSKSFEGVLKFKEKSFEKLHYFIYENIKGVLASDIDYHLPLRNHPHYLGLIPNPINVEKHDYIATAIQPKINIFLGINNESYFKKGSDYFEKALAIIQEKYSDKVTVTVTRSIPYKTYIHLYEQAHILLDQVYAYDQGYNALEAMAKGKVVFTGAETEFMAHYDITEKVAINAKPDVDYLVAQLSFLIENPDEITAIGKRARSFIENEHHYIKIAKQYLKKWSI